jgi:hypothetical protein
MRSAFSEPARRSFKGIPDRICGALRARGNNRLNTFFSCHFPAKQSLCHALPQSRIEMNGLAAALDYAPGAPKSPPCYQGNGGEKNAKAKAPSRREGRGSVH